MPHFEEGDVVQLKSGGPKMTVEGRAAGNPKNVICSWFVGDEPERQPFNENALKMAEGPDD